MSDKPSTSRWQRIAAKVRSSWRGLVANVFLRRYRVLQVIFVVVAAIISTVVVTTMLFRTPSVPEAAVRATRLEVSTVDEMEVVIEDRQTAYENPPGVPAAVFSP